MLDYNETKIYIIENTIGQPIYIGHTIQSLNHRWIKYRYDHQNSKHPSYNWKIHELMRDHDFDNFSIELLEDYPCQNRHEAETREGYYMLMYRDDYGVPICNTIIEGTNLTGTSKTSLSHKNNPARYQKFLVHQRTKVTCYICHAVVARGNICRHQKTQKCIRNR
jgi:hypothetical protein